MKKRTTRCLALLLAVVMVLSVMPIAMAEETTQTQTYTKVTSAAELTAGKYVLVTRTPHTSSTMPDTSAYDPNSRPEARYEMTAAMPEASSKMPAT